MSILGVNGALAGDHARTYRKGHGRLRMTEGPPQQIRGMKLFEGRFVLSADGRFHQFMTEDMKNACQQNNRHYLLRQ